MSEQNVIKIVIDTNIWIRFLLGRDLDPLVNALKAEKIEIFFSNDLHDELFEVMSRPKFKGKIQDSQKTEILEITRKNVKTIIPSSINEDCRDPKDNFLLDLAVSANADYLVTGDLDLLALNPFRGVRIVEPPEFERMLREK